MNKYKKSFCESIQAVVIFFAISIVVPASQSALADNPNFLIGVIAPLSGPLSEYGLAAQNGIELARAEHPELFTNLEFIYEDSQWDAKAAVSAFNSLRNSKRVSLIYNWGNPTTEALAPIAEKYQIPLVGMTLDPTVASGKRFVIRSTNSAADFASVSAGYLKEKKFKNIGVVIAENSYVQGLFSQLEKSLAGTAKIEIVDRYNIQDQDFRSSITKIRSRKYDCIGVFLITGQVSGFYRQLSDQGVVVPTIGTDFFESATEIKLAKGGMDGSVYPHLGVSKKFHDNYVSRFNNDYQLAYAGNAYDMAVTWGSLFNKLPKASSADEVMNKLRLVKDQVGVGGTFSYFESAEAGPHYHFPVQLKKVVGDSFQVISKVNAPE